MKNKRARIRTYEDALFNQFGLIDEEVAAVDPGPAARDKNGEIYNVRYDAVNAMLFNEFLKEHRILGAQDATIAQLPNDSQVGATRQQEQIDAVTEDLQKVRAQLELRKSHHKQCACAHHFTRGSSLSC